LQRLHHPLWNGQRPDDALPWLQEQIAAVQAVHPGRLVVIAETGWATSKADEREQARLMKGAVGEVEQAAFYDAVRRWAAAERRTIFFFEAFDENWKGGPDPNDAEKHWGFFRADRAPKLAVR
jgi:exo-beta-1,3-glucanase (GH17 family)